MKIGIIGAMEVEVNNIIAAMELVQKSTVAGKDFFLGKIGTREVVVAQSGIGKVSAAICAQIMIDKFSAGMIINVGVAGTLTDELKIGNIAIAESAVQHDMDTTPLGDPPGLISGINIVNLPCEPKIAAQLRKSAESAGINCKTGVIASGDQFIESTQKKEWLHSSFNAIAAEMEGAPIAHVCYVNNIPCGILRSISDGSDSSMDYNTFVNKAAAVSTAVILDFLQNYND